MANVPDDNTARDIVEDVVATLRNVQQNNEAAFATVEQFASLEAAQAALQPLRGVAVGVVPGVVEYLPPLDGEQEYQCRLPVQVVVGFQTQRAPGAGEAAAAGELLRLGELVRTALRADPSRGRRATLILPAGPSSRPVNGTDCTGRPQVLKAKAAQAWQAAVVPIVCGWAIPAAA